MQVSLFPLNWSAGGLIMQGLITTGNTLPYMGGSMAGGGEKDEAGSNIRLSGNVSR